MRHTVRADHSLFGWPDTRASAAGALRVIGVPLELGNPIAKGSALGPARIRQLSLESHSPLNSGIGFDAGDLDVSGEFDLKDALERLERATDDCYSFGDCPMILGGDHSISFGSIYSAQKTRDIQVIWLDAHTDFSEWDDDEAHDHKQVLRRVSGLNGVRAITQIGYRGFTVGDETNLGPGSRVITSLEAASMDGEDLLRLISDELPCYISIDIDVVDPWLAPGTGAPVPGGITVGKLTQMVTTLITGRDVIGIDLVEVNPLLDVRNATSRIGARLLHSMAAAWAPDSD